MILAQLADHEGDIVEKVDGAVLVASILASHHEIGGVAREAGGREVVPAG